MSTSRPSRKKKKVPSASYYLGYVEDDESIEAIMAKFEELEKIKSNLPESSTTSSLNNNENGKEPMNEKDTEEGSYLDEELQEELFKRTSHHSIQSNIYSQIMSNCIELEQDEQELDEINEEASDYSSDEDYVDENLDRDDSDDSNDETMKICVSDSEMVEDEIQVAEEDDEEIIQDDENRVKKKRKSTPSTKSKRASSTTTKKESTNIKDLITLDPNMNFLNSFEGSTTLSGNSKKSKTTTNIELVNIPTAEKILNSWSKKIQRVTTKECTKQKAYSECQTIDLTNFEENFANKLIFNRISNKKSSSFVSTVYTFDTEEDVIITNRVLDYNFKSICKNQPFDGILIDPPYHSIKVKDLKKLPLDKKWFMERGYCFVWIEKEHTVEIVKIMKEFELEYVDSLTWVKETIHQKPSTISSQLIPKGKLNLFIFRKMNDLTKNMHIKHQRNADIVLDFEKQDNPRHRPPVIFHMIETLLSSCDRFLELWGEGCYQNCKYKTNSKWTIIKEE